MIEDIYELRKNKMQVIMKDLQVDTPVKFVGYCGAVEVNQVRTSYSQAYGIAQQQQRILEASQKRMVEEGEEVYQQQ